MQAIDTLALNLQNKWVFGDCLAFAQSAIQAQNTYLRAAGCTVLVVIAEGCCDACTAKLPDLLQVGTSKLWCIACYQCYRSTFFVIAEVCCNTRTAEVSVYSR